MAKTTQDLVMEAVAQVEAISPMALRSELDAGDVRLIDVREPMEWEQHISGAVQIPRGLLEFVADPECGPRLPESLRIGLGPTERVVVYCNTGGRGALAARTLKIMGYDRVANLDGGLAAWRDAGLPISEHHGALL